MLLEGNKYAKRLTPESHYEMVLKADNYLNSDEVPEMHKKIIKMFAYHGMSARAIARTGEIIGKRGCMDSDMISIWIKRYFPGLEYDEKSNNYKRGHDGKHTYRMKLAKEKLLKEAPYCAICGSTHNLELDHIFSVGVGGDDDISNLQLLCHECHCEKTQQERIELGYKREALRKKNEELAKKKVISRGN